MSATEVPWIARAVCLCLLLRIGTLAGQDQEPPTATVQPDFVDNASEVAVPFRAVDAQGQPVAGLTVRDIRVLDEGREAPIMSLTGDVANAAVVVLVDVSGSMGAVIESLRGALYAFSDILAHGNQEAGGLTFSLVPFSETATPLVDRTSNPVRFKEAVDRLRIMGSTALIDATLACVQNAFGPPPKPGVPRPSRFLVILTDSGENASSHQWSDVASAVLSNEVVVYAIHFRSGTPDGSPGAMSNVAVRSGGKMYSATAKDLETVYAAVAHDIHSYYQLTFQVDYDQISHSHRWRRIQISVPKRPDVRIAARAGYCLEKLCQTEDGLFIGERPRTLQGLVALTAGETNSLQRRLNDLGFEYGRETPKIIEGMVKHPLIVEKFQDDSIPRSGAPRPGGVKPRFQLMTDSSVSLDAEICTFKADVPDRTVHANVAPEPPAHETAQQLLTVSNAFVRTVTRRGGGPEDDYFQSQALFDVRDPSGRIPFRIEAQCGRPYFIVGQDLIEFAVQSLQFALKVRLKEAPQN